MLGSLTKRRWHMILLALLTLAMVLPGLSSLPVIDRDEARFAQASMQMAESNDWMNIRFQDEARNKKPAAAYWAQTAMIKTVSRDGEPRLWAQRLPSVFAALITILALYWGGLRMVGRNASLLAAALLATSIIFVFEGHIAKTDALLCASTTTLLACLGRLRLWARPLLNWGAILLFILIWLPWGIAMYVITDGAFYVESLGKDFGGKITSGQESHGAPPGSHSLAIWATLWPGSLFLLPGLAYATRAVRSGQDNSVIRSMRYIFCWVVPFWVLIELTPTKLPHYELPVLPALCLMMGTAVLAMKELDGFGKTRFFSGLLFLLSTTFVLGALLYVQIHHGEMDKAVGVYIICGISGLIAIIAGVAIWGNKIRLSMGAALLSALICSAGAYTYILPNLTAFRLAERVQAELEHFAPGTNSANIHSPHFTEPSLVYHLGSEIDVTARKIKLSDGSVVILNAQNKNATKLSRRLSRQAKRHKACLKNSNPIKGFNYSNGEEVTLVILQEGPC